MIGIFCEENISPPTVAIRATCWNINKHCVLLTGSICIDFYVKYYI